MNRILIGLLVMLSSAARADFTLNGNAVRLSPQTSAPSLCALSQCSWYDSSATALKLRMPDGSDPFQFTVDRAFGLSDGSGAVGRTGLLLMRNHSGALEINNNNGGWTAIGGSVQVVSPLSGNGTAGTPLTFISGTQHQVIVNNGSNWTAAQLTLDDIGAAFTVTLAFNGISSPVEIGSTVVNPQLTDTHNQTPSAASLQDNVGTQSITPATLTALGYGGVANTFSAHTYSYPGSLNSTATWTYSATNIASITKTSAVTMKWSPKVYYGMAVPATYNAAFITGLSTSSLSAVTGITISYAAGGGTKEACYALPSSYTAPVSFNDTATGFGVSYSRVAASVSVTNAFSVSTNYDLYCTDFLLSAAFTGKWQ